MKKKLTLDWLYAAGVRAIKTMAQTALGMFTVGMAATEVDWLNILSVSVVAGVFSILTSIVTKLPEAENDGSFEIDTSDPNTDICRLNLDTDLEDVKGMRRIVLKVDPDAKLDSIEGSEM